VLNFSYDYDAMITESGQLTAKWHATRDLLDTFGLLPKDLPELSANNPVKDYGHLQPIGWVPLRHGLEVGPKSESRIPLAMELLSLNKGYGQSYGYIAYEKDIPNVDGQLVIQEVHDRAIVLVNDEEKTVIEYTKSAEKNHKVQVNVYH
jgi:beta-galactosidase